jgi:hypothetical protein
MPSLRRGGCGHKPVSDVPKPHPIVLPQPTPPIEPPVDLEAHFKKAAYYHEQVMYDAAIAEYDAILKVDPGNTRAKAGRKQEVDAKKAEADVQK